MDAESQLYIIHGLNPSPHIFKGQLCLLMTLPYLVHHADC